MSKYKKTLKTHFVDLQLARGVLVVDFPANCKTNQTYSNQDNNQKYIAIKRHKTKLILGGWIQMV